MQVGHMIPVWDREGVKGQLSELEQKVMEKKQAAKCRQAI